ncbi:MAG TPA: MFS transporter [Selenomonadales bacterium]|nr:MFS transporter [Selenomonadales bacterium]
MTSMKPTNVRWGVFFTLLVLCTINYVDRAVLSICMPAIQKDLSLDPAIVGVILSSFFWGYAAMQIPVGWLLDRFRPDKLIVVSAALWGVFQMLTGFVSSSKMFMFLRVLLGISESPIYPGGTKLQSVWLTSKERARGSSLMDSGAALGNAVGGPLVILFMTWFGGWRGALIGAGIVTLAVAAMSWRFIKGTPETNPRVNQSERDYIKNALAEEYEGSKTAGGSILKNVGIRDYLTSRNFWCMLIGFFAIDAYWFGLMTWGPNFLADTQKLDIKTIGGSVLLIFGTGAVVELIGGMVTDKWRQTGDINTVMRTLLGLLAIGMSVSMYFLSKATTLTAALAWLTIGVSFERWAGMLFFVIPPAISQRNHVGTVAGCMNFVGNLAGVFTPICIGLIVSLTGSYNGALMMFVGFGIMILVSALFLDFSKKVGSDASQVVQGKVSAQ